MDLLFLIYSHSSADLYHLKRFPAIGISGYHLRFFPIDSRFLPAPVPVGAVSFRGGAELKELPTLTCVPEDTLPEALCERPSN
ncbi:MAG: hypothetical protein Q7T96_02495 [Methylobacter sp.]|nr:hypothetical protein [Methylobacter sp.]